MIKKTIRHILLILTILSTLALLWSSLTTIISPKYLHVLAFAGFAFPIFWLANFTFLILNSLRKSWRVLIPLAALIITWNHLGNTFQTGKWVKSNESKSQKAIKIMSFNTRMFDYYQWTGRKNTLDEVLTFIRRENPDILCIQEFFTYDKHTNYSENSIVFRLNEFPYHHIEYNAIGKNGRKFGQATFSKFPITGEQQLNFTNTTNFSIQTDIKVHNQTIRVFNNHLESIRLKAKHYNFLDSLNTLSETERNAGIREIAIKLNTALGQRANQAETIGRHIKNSPYPVLVCGDFNDTPVSYVYRTMRGKLSDSFVEAGFGFGGTYNGKLPSFRIDFIFHDPQFEAIHFERFEKDYSDHYPIMATILLK